MQKKKRDFPFSPLEAILLAILVLIIYVGSFRLLLRPINKSMLSTQLACLMVIGFDVIWCIAMKLWPLKNIRIKIVLSLLVLTVSASVLSCFIFLESLSPM